MRNSSGTPAARSGPRGRSTCRATTPSSGATSGATSSTAGPRPTASPTSTARPISPTATRSTTTARSSPASTGRGASRATSPTARARPSSIATRAAGSTRRTTSSSPPTARSGSPTRRTGSSTTARATRPTRSWAAASSSGSIGRRGELTMATDFLIHPNGLAFSPDERTLYVSDTSIARVEGAQPPHRRVRRHRWAAARAAADLPRHGAGPLGRLPRRCRRATSGPRPATASTSSTPTPSSSGGSSSPSRRATARSAAPDGRRLFITATSTLWSIEVGIRGAVTPWVDGALERLTVRRVVEDGLGLAGAPGGEALGEVRVGGGQDRGRQQPGVRGVADRRPWRRARRVASGRSTAASRGRRGARSGSGRR